MYKRLIIFLFVGLPFFAVAQELSYNHYTVHDGLAQMQIEDLLLDTRGALWVATRGGVSRFNGYSFDSFEDVELKPGYCSEIIEDRDGKIIILGGEGLYIFNGESFSFYKAPDKLRFNHMSFMTLDDDGYLWINAHNSTPIIFKDSTFLEVVDLYPNITLDSVRQVYFHEASKRLLISIFKKGIFQLVKDSLVPVINTDKSILICSSRLKGCSSNGVFIREFTPSRSKVFSLDENLNTNIQFEEYMGEITYMEEPLQDDFVFLDQARENLFLIESGEKVSRKLISDLGTKFNLPGEAYLDDSGNIFLESDKGIVSINFNRFEKLEKFKAQNVWTINQMENGDMFFGGYGTGFKIYNFEGEEKKIKPKDKAFCDIRSLNNELKFIYMGSAKGFSNDLLIPTANTIVKYSNNEFTIFDYDESCENSLPSLFVYSDLENRRFLSATCSGLRILDENGNLLRVIKDGLFDHRCLLTINKDLEGKYWIGATGGIANYDYETEEIKNYTKENRGFPYKGVVCTFVDFKGTLWAGSREGLTYFDEQKDKFVALEGFDGVEVASMITGEESQLFLSTAGALIEANLKSFYKDGKMLHRVYDKNNGLGIIGSGQNGFFKDAEDKIWCTSDTEVYRFDPKNLRSNINTPDPNIVLINDQRISSTAIEKGTKLSEGTNNLTIEYESIGLNASNNLKYAYLLEGYDDEWSEYSKYKNCTYNNLGSGSYTFKVKNNQSEEIAQQQIEIDIPIYKEPYFGGFAGITAISLLLLSMLLGRNYRLTKNNNELLKSQEVQLRTDKKNLENINRLEQENKLLLEKQNQELAYQKEELEELNQKLQQDISAIKKSNKNQEIKLQVKTKGKINYVLARELLFIQAEENGCRYFLKDGNSIWNDKKLKSWEEKLDPTLFVRIHRSTIVQKEYISKISYDKLSLLDNTELKIGRKYKENL